MAEHLSRKQNALLARQNSLLSEIKYYKLKIKEESSASNNNNLICDDSSDSESEFTVEVGLSVTELKLKQLSLKTCLQATQELTGVAVLQSEVNILVHEPVLEGELPVAEEGVWREVISECRIDLVPFSINFYVHKPSRMFGPMSYRNLQVTPVKSSHEVELAKSILNKVRQPSDAIEIIRNYSAAHRSRRTTLARLAEKYGEALFMVPMTEGGYKLKCVELMEVQWSLQNKWSPLAPFHHRMVFDLEFMDESYIKTISTLHRQIIDPTIDTDDRTLLLARIIDTCLEAKAHTTQNQAEESTESESEAAEKLRRRRTTLDQEPQEPERSRKKDSEVMAPPKSLPKKTKPKGKENTTDNKAKPVKRAADDPGDKEIVKKAKTVATKKLTETKNTENKTKSTKNKADKVNKDNTENGGKINDEKVNIYSINSDTNPKNCENVIKMDKKKHLDNVKKQSNSKDKAQINNIKESNKSEKSKKTVKANKQQTQKSDDKINLNLGTERLQIDKDFNKNKQNSEENVEPNKERKLSANVIKNIKPKQNHIIDPKCSKSEDSTNNKDNPAITKDSKIKAPDTVVKKSAVKSKENPNKQKSVLAGKTHKEKKTLAAKVPNLVKNSKDMSKKPTTGYLKNSFLPKVSNKLKSTLATKIPRISPRKLSSIKSGIQDISKNSRSSQKSLQKATNIPRLLKKPQIFKTNKV